MRLARTIFGADHAEDVAQDSLLLAFKALPGIEEPRKFGAWLSAITRHRALRFSKSETTRTNGRVALDEALLEKIEALARPLVDKEHDEATIAALESLPLPCDESRAQRVTLLV
ncbi:MAG TPA: sigma factor [Pyrinomonadaceae bacterium]|nr:sigma factor [Pyrinomonadaceae bacterium]